MSKELKPLTEEEKDEIRSFSETYIEVVLVAKSGLGVESVAEFYNLNYAWRFVDMYKEAAAYDTDNYHVAVRTVKATYDPERPTNNKHK